MQIFLIGYMGSGKTHWGNLWSKSSSFSFIDLDEEIEKKEKKTIAHVFDEKGEDYFRKIETETLHSLINHKNIIISCGGGTPCFHENMQWMNKNGITVYLKVTPEQLVNRLKKEKQKRPLLKDLADIELENFIEQKLIIREEFYLQAKIILNVEKVTTETINEIINYPLSTIH